MKRILSVAMLCSMLACNNKKEDKTTTVANENAPVNTTTTSNPSGSGTSNVQLAVDGKEMSLNGSILVSRDEKKLQPGADFLCMLTAMNGSNDESLILNFLMDTKPGTYPVVGMSLSRGTGDNGEVYGGLMGGETKITGYKVNLTEVRDLGSNGLGGHKWSISGTVDDLTIPAMSIMLMDKSKNHPAEVKITKISFANLSFDDNWEQLMEKAVEQMK